VVARNRVFARYLVTVADLGEKPGFLELAGGGQKPFVVVFPPHKQCKISQTWVTKNEPKTP
jgi:hypothetical protein